MGIEGEGTDPASEEEWEYCRVGVCMALPSDVLEPDLDRLGGMARNADRALSGSDGRPDPKLSACAERKTALSPWWLLV